MSWAGEDILKIFRDEAGACDQGVNRAREQVEQHRLSINEGVYNGVDPKLSWWFVETFVANPEERARILRAYHAILEFFMDLNRLALSQGKPAMPINRDVVTAMRGRILAAMYPSPREVAVGARKHSSERAARTLERLTTESSWRERL